MFEQSINPFSSDRQNGVNSWWLFIPVLGLLLTLAYAPAWPGAFIWDDDSALVENPLIYERDGLRRIWFSTEPLEYYPVFYTSLRLQWALWGGRTSAYLAVNVLLHGLNTLLFFGVLGRFRAPGRMWAALLFGLHPVNVFTVAWISQHKTTLSTFLFLLCILAWLPSKGRLRRAGTWLSLLLFVLALLCKPTLIMLPVFFWLVVCEIPGERHDARWRGIRRVLKAACARALRLWPFFLASLLVGVLRVFWKPPIHYDWAPPRVDSLWEHVVLPGRAVFFYLWKLLVPLDLMMIYPRWDVSGAEVFAVLPTVALVALCITCWCVRHKFPACCLCFSFFLLGLFPLLGFFDNQYFTFSLVANHWVYMPMMGIAAFGGLQADRVMRMASPLARSFGALLLVGILAFFIVRSRSEASRFSDARVYYERGVRENANNVVAHQNLANICLEAGERESALGHYLEAVRIHPAFWQAHNLAARLLIERGAYEQGANHLHEALAVYPGNVEAYQQLGMLYGRLGHPHAAVTHLVRAAMLNPDDPVVFNNLGAAYYQAGDLEQARVCFEEALRLHPGYESARNNLSALLRQKNGELEMLAPPSTHP